MAASNLPSIPNVQALLSDGRDHLSREYYEYLRKIGALLEQLIVTQGREFYSVALLEAASLTTVDATVRLTLATQGTAVLRRATTAPAHDAYVTSADGGFYVFESGCLFPELCGAVADDATDNTDTLIAWATAFSTLNPQSAAFEKDGIYRLLNEAQATAHHNATTITIADCTFFAINFNGATLRTTFTGTWAPECIRFDNCQNFTVTDFVGLQDKSQGAPVSTYGTRWVQFVKGCAHFSFVGASLSKGLSGVTVTRAAASADARCEHFNLQFETTAVYYATAYQWSGDHSTLDLDSTNAGRSFIGYNFTDLKGRIVSAPANVIIGDLLIGCNGHNADQFITSDIDLEYISHTNGQAGACPIAFNLGQTTEGNAGMVNYALAMQNVRIHFDIRQPNPFAQIVATGSFKFSAGTLVIGDDVGYSMTGIRLSGMVNGDPQSQFLSLGESANGFSINTVLGFALHDIKAIQVTHAIDLGQYAEALISNVDMVGGDITRAGGYDERYLTIIHCRSADEGSGLWYSKIG